MNGRLLVSISSIFRDTLPAAARTLADLDSEGLTTSLLIAPHIDGDWHLAKDPETLDWVRAERDAGRAILLNGFDQAVQGRRAEFDDLPAHEARLRLKGATRQMASLGVVTDLFAPPRWRLSPGTLEVADEFGFRLIGSTRGVYLREPDPDDDKDAAGPWRLVSSRNLSVGEGFGSPGWWRRNIIKAARRGAKKGNTIRLSASARNLAEEKVARDFVAAAVAAAEGGARPASYAELVAETTPSN
ncbi:DUF2334 domain-containing protein [Corynebacterium frankenforstense]|uniref:DUF2334 domain-containing protein n=1 Tax=Corynebacterium frankenforstense TaxID=1230998 RepID=UPI0026F1F436|nr:DUF2334 domain-containing protein [Corynebacterium frankenforstense]